MKKPERAQPLTVFSIPEVFPKRSRVIGQERVHQAEELHHTLILPQIFMAFQQENKLVPIAACKKREATDMGQNYSHYSPRPPAIPKVLRNSLPFLVIVSPKTSTYTPSN